MSPATARIDGPRPSCGQHVVGDIHGDRRTIQPTEQIGTPTGAGAEIENQVVRRRL
jgi:hypothetical protein